MTRSRQSPWIIAATACLLATPAIAQGGFDGTWRYEQSCDMQHIAELHLTMQGNKATGNWSDGAARGQGEAGSLQGEARDGKLYVRYCYDPEASTSTPACPAFDGPLADYYVMHGNTLDWYRASGSGHEKYLTLHRKTPGHAVPTDDRCDDQ